MDFERELDPTEDGKKVVKVVKRTLFPLMNPYPQKKVLTFNKHVEDFSFNVNYGNLTALPDDEVAALGSTSLSQVDLKGIADVLAQYGNEEGVEFKGIKAHFAVDDSGLLSLGTVETTFEKVHAPAADAELAGNATAESADEADANATAANSTAAKTEKKPKIETLKKDLESVQVVLDLQDLTGNAFKTANQRYTSRDLSSSSPSRSCLIRKLWFHSWMMVLRIADLNEKDRVRKEKEMAKNGLETFILDTQDKLTQSEYEGVTTEDERAEILAKCSDISDWLYEEGDDADAAVYADKMKQLNSLTEGMYERYRQHRDRPEVVAAFQNAINVSASFMDKFRNATPDEKYLDDDDLEYLGKLLDENRSWLDKKLADQQATPLHQKPALTLQSVADKMTDLDKKVKVLINKAKTARTKRLKELADKLKEFDKKQAEEEKEKEKEKEVGDGKDEDSSKENDADDKKTTTTEADDKRDTLDGDDEHVEL